MAFVSFAFPALLLLVLVGRLVFRKSSHRTYQTLLLFGSLTFYAWHVPPYIGILLFSTVVDYWVGRALGAAAEGRRKWLLSASMATNLGLLGFFKYHGFFLDNVSTLAEEFGLSFSRPTLELALPIGISFYTFQSMSYSIDVYRRHLKPERRFGRFLLYVAFFPQLVAGPIVRAREFFYQLDRPRRIRAAFVMRGGYLIISGLFLKMVVADNLGHLVDSHWDAASAPEGARWMALAVTVMFGGQIFCDFAGYTNLARGVAYLLGFRLPINFNAPYLACTFSGFWRRWHISLSQWLRDYLYVPMGGNRRGVWRCQVNLLVVMLLGGLWHGAAWTFVVWGSIHGVALLVERGLGVNEERLARNAGLRWCWPLLVQAVVFLAWAIFRAPTLASGMNVVVNIFIGTGSTTGLAALGPLGLPCLAAVVLVHVLPACKPGPRWQAAGAGLMLLAVFMFYRVHREFIYFQF